MPRARSRRLEAACLMALFLVVPHAGAFSPPRPGGGVLAPGQRSARLPAVQQGRPPLRAATRPNRPCTMQAEDQSSVSIPAPGRTLTLERDEDCDALSSALSEKLEQLEGIWYSDDFYGPHGREWVVVSATLVGAGTSALVAVKVKGDANVPSGFTTWQTKGLPDVGGAVPAQVQVRADPNDPNGFSWVPASLVLVSEDRISITAFWSSDVKTRGTFHKHKVEGA
jgi:hypothetical protein